MSTTYFSEHTFDFLRQLAQHNNREWFQEHKADYESHVREPARAFIRAMQPELARIAPHFIADDRKQGGSLIRIYRDTRFAKNKQPYKTHIGIHFRHKQGRNIHAPGFYLHIEPHKVFAGAGIWHPDAPTLRRIRHAIDTHPQQWRKISGEPHFARLFHFSGNSLQNSPRGYAADHPLIQDLKRKDFIALTPLAPELMTDTELPAFIGSCFATAAPLVAWLCRAIGLSY